MIASMLPSSLYFVAAFATGGAWSPASPAPVQPLLRRTLRCPVRLALDADADVENGLNTDAEAAAQAVEVEFVRDPPAYPDELHSAAKADRDGPFWSSLGEPDATTGVRPAYLRRDDWHISSTYTTEQREAVQAEEQAWAEESAAIDTAAVAALAAGEAVDDQEEDDDGAWKPTDYEYMQLEPEVADGGKPSELSLPSSWQEYQALQARMDKLLDADTLKETVRAEATRHQAQLADFYETFKGILERGWTLLNDHLVEDAVRFIDTHDPVRSDGTTAVSAEEIEELFAA